ncbi:AmmeMemoRadiSam system protein B [Sulfurimonas sp.]|uniref:AmmeMemoRadiSam system protein B n=1 Tax=Sulfurimonas sp. TaxID=2022749 RepID=UPI003D0F5431
MQREMSVSGTFYPSRALELERYFEHFSSAYDETSTLPDIKSRAVIVPHAGYVYSGYTANIAYRVLQKSGIKTFVVIGPSHRVAYDGVSLCDFSSYDTPFGSIAAATKLSQSLKEMFTLPCYLQAHAEHSTEVQFPFIKYYIEDASIVELVYSQMNPHTLSEIIDFLLSKEDVGVIISTDLSHFYTLKEASKLDSICLEAIKELDVGMLKRGCEACGHIGIEAMLLSTKKLGLHPHILDYRTSADASDDTSRVVGYVSACFA